MARGLKNMLASRVIKDESVNTDQERENNDEVSNEIQNTIHPIKGWPFFLP